jgi:hypothetical protein
MMFRSFLIAVILLGACPAFGAVNDGFGDASKIESSHFTVHLKKDVDINALLAQLQISGTDLTITGRKIDSSTPESKLAGTLEVLFERTCDVLDMHVGSFKGSIKVFATKQDLKDFFQRLYPKLKIPCTGISFYSNDFKTIYVSADSFKREILGHEMGHAVISSYFVVMPSIKIQEVLAGYVEFSLRKTQ